MPSHNSIDSAEFDYASPKFKWYRTVTYTMDCQPQIRVTIYNVGRGVNLTPDKESNRNEHYLTNAKL